MSNSRHKWAHLYDRRWKRERALFLQKHPLCVYCEQEGVVEQATIVDHRKPHKGDLHLFWDRSNWQPMCKPHHDSAKAKQEATGQLIGCDASGIPFAGWE